MATDTLVSGTDDRAAPRRGRRAAVVVLLLVAVALVAAERWERQRQLDRLLDAATATEQVVQDSRRSLSGLVQYSGALLARTDLEPAQRAAVLDSLAVDAGRFPPRVEGLRADVAGVRPLPWDGDLERARELYLLRIDAWTTFVADAQAEPGELLLERRVTRPARQAAAEALTAASDGRSAEQVAAVREALLRR